MKESTSIINDRSDQLEDVQIHYTLNTKQVCCVYDADYRVDNHNSIVLDKMLSSAKRIHGVAQAVL